MKPPSSPTEVLTQTATDGAPQGPGTARPWARRRTTLALALAAGVALLTACAAPLPAFDITHVRHILAPTGALRVGVYPGSPTSLVRGPGEQEMRGVTVEVGRAMADRLQLRADIVVFERVAEVIDALKQGRVDMTITNATPARATEVDFTPALIGLELGLLVPAGSTLSTVEAMDQTGLRIGVSQGSSSQAALGARLKAARLVPAPSLNAAANLLRTGQIDAFATNKGILFELADQVPGSRVLSGRWGLESLALAIPKGRTQAREWVQNFAREAAASGLVSRAAERAGLRGTVSP